MKKPFRLVLAGLVMCLSGCSSPNVEDYAQRTPTLDLREYFNGDFTAFGAFFDWAGDPNTRFSVTLNGKWKGNTGVLTETFTYDDGTIKHRKWNITFTDDHNFTATADDVVGVATGKQYGNAAHITYILQVPKDGTTYNMRMDDWLYRIDETTVINRNSMRKFGLQVGELVIGFNRPASKK